MLLNINTLKEVGAFTGAPVEKQVTWLQGEEELTATVFVRPMSYQTAINDITAITGKRDLAAGRIAACICDAEGKAVFTPEDVTGEADPERGPLNHGLTVALLNVIGEVSGLGKSPKSPKTTNSGASSSSTASADEPSRKRKSGSRTRNS